MDRRSFLGYCSLGPAVFGLSKDFLSDCPATIPSASPSGRGVTSSDRVDGGVRRLSKDKNFTLYRAGLSPNYRVQLDEVVLV